MHFTIQSLQNFKDTDRDQDDVGGLHRCVWGYNSVRSEVQHGTPRRQKISATSVHILLILEIGALIALAASYLNGETRREAREGAVHPKRHRLPSHSGRGVPRLLIRSWSRWHHLESIGEHSMEFLKKSHVDSGRR